MLLSGIVSDACGKEPAVTTGPTDAASKPVATQPTEQIEKAKAELEAATERGGQLYKNGRHAEAAVEYEKALKLGVAVHGKSHHTTARTLNNLAFQHDKMGQLAKAEALYLRSLKVYETVGSACSHYATAMGNLGALHKSMGQYAKAEPLYLRSLKIKEAKLGKDHTEVARTLNNLAGLYQAMGQYAKAEPLVLRSLKISEAKLGKDHPDVAVTLNNLAVLYQAMGQYAKAEPLVLRSLKIKEAKLGKDHPSVAVSLNNLAGLYWHMGQYAKAEPLFLRSLKIWEAKLPKDHPDVARSLNDLAGLYFAMGEYPKAEPLYLRSLKIWEAKRGKDHPEVAASLNNLAGLYESMGEYAKAEPLYLRSLKIFEAKLGKDHPKVAGSLSNLALLYEHMGQYAKAEPLYLRSLKIRQAKLGKDHPDVAACLNNLAGLYQAMGQYVKAEPLLLRSLKIMEAKLGKDHPNLGFSLNNLATLYQFMGEHAKAEPLLLRSLKIWEAKLGKDHPEVATSLNNLAGLYQAMGQHAKAEPLLLRSLKIWEAKLGKDHPHVATSLNNLAWLYVSMGQYAEAWNAAERGSKILQRTRSRSGRSVLGRSAFYGEHSRGDLLPCLALKLNKKVDVLELLEQQRAIGLRELLAQSRAQAASTLSEADQGPVTAAIARINGLQGAIERSARKGQSVEAFRTELQRAEMDYDDLMVEVRKQHEHFAATETAQAVTSEQIVKSPAMDGGTAIVGWVEHGDWVWGYVIRSSGIKWVDLSKDFDRKEQGKLTSQVYSAAWYPSKRTLSAEDAFKLYRTRIAPLEKHLEGVRKLIVINQGWAAYLPAEMLLTKEPPKGETDMSEWPWLDRKYRVSYAPSATTLDILCRQRAKRKDTKWPQPLFAMADPPFSEKQLAAMKAEKAVPVGPALAAAGPSDSALTRLLRFDRKAVPQRLPGTRHEVRMIAGLLKADKSCVLLGPDASERKLFAASKSGRLKQCRYVHISTHGFADSDRPELSGLVLARVPPDKDYDGILQMREVFHLKLSADLVVLSACQTGLGKYLSGEGILGLSTAFFFAGTPSIVMSLWNAPDAPTALLMQRFYRNLKAGQTKAAALGEAKAWLRNLTRSELAKLGRTDPHVAQITRGLGEPVTAPKGKLKDDKPFAHPHYWAAFILTGDPR